MAAFLCTSILSLGLSLKVLVGAFELFGLLFGLVFFMLAELVLPLSLNLSFCFPVCPLMCRADLLPP